MPPVGQWKREWISGEETATDARVGYNIWFRQIYGSEGGKIDGSDLQNWQKTDTVRSALAVFQDGTVDYSSMTFIRADVTSWAKDAPLPIKIRDNLMWGPGPVIQEMPFVKLYGHNTLGFNTPPFMIVPSPRANFPPNPIELMNLSENMAGPLLETMQHYLFVDKPRMEALRAEGKITAEDLEEIKFLASATVRPSGEAITWETLPNTRYETYSIDYLKAIESPWTS